MEVVSTDTFDFKPIIENTFPDFSEVNSVKDLNRREVYIYGQKTSLTLVGRDLEACIKIDQNYVAFITYYTGIEDESRRLAIYLINKNHIVLDYKEIVGSAFTYMFGEDVDDRFYGVELQEPNSIIFDFVYSAQHKLTLCRSKASFGYYLKLSNISRNLQRERITNRYYREYHVVGRQGPQSVEMQTLNTRHKDSPNLTIETPYYNGVYSDKSQVYVDGRYTQLNLMGTLLRKIIQIDEYYLFIIGTMINAVEWENLHLVSSNFQILETVKLHDADRLKVTIDDQSYRDNSLILDYSRPDKTEKHYHLRCWISRERKYRYLWLPEIVSKINEGVSRPVGIKSYFQFKKIKEYLG